MKELHHRSSDFLPSLRPYFLDNLSEKAIFWDVWCLSERVEADLQPLFGFEGKIQIWRVSTQSIKLSSSRGNLSAARQATAKHLWVVVGYRAW